MLRNFKFTLICFVCLGALILLFNSINDSELRSYVTWSPRRHHRNIAAFVPKVTKCGDFLSLEKRIYCNNRNSIWDTECGDRIEIMLDQTYSDSSTKFIWLENGHQYWGIPKGDQIFKNKRCNVPQCRIVDNFHEGNVDARLFSQNFIFANIQLAYKQAQRSPEEVWIIFILESPYATPNYVGLQGIFNWTMTYRKDSTIVTPYAKWVKTSDSTRQQHTAKNYAVGKTKKVAMFVSNCESANNRLEYARELSLFIPVDIYGDCGNLTCDKDKADECFKMLQRDYKFFLAFENANCRHYMTEKLFVNALSNDVLPIVMGAHPDDYREMAPPNSYIHVEEFESPRYLANYLNKLDQDDRLYNEYFKWKSRGRFIDTKFWCRLCAMLHAKPRPNKVISNLNQWWRRKETCLPSRIYRWDSDRR